MQLFGHSFITHFKRFIRTNASDFDYNLNLDKREVMIQYSGYPGASVEALIQRGLSDVYDFEPDLVILDIGTNDLSSSPPEKVANDSVSLVNSLLCTTYVKKVFVLQVLHRFNPTVPVRYKVDIDIFNPNVNQCNDLLATKLKDRNDCQLWWHKGFWGPYQHLTIAPDGVHLSDPYDQRKYFYSLRSIVVSYLKAY